MTIAYIVVGLALLLYVLYMMGPRDYTVERSKSIARPRSEVFSYLRNLKNQNDWGPWARMDPNMEQTFTGTDGQVGFISKWKGNNKVGEGQQEIMRIDENEVIGTHMTFIKPFKAESDIELRLKDRGNGETMVTWHMHGKNNSAMSRIFSLFMNMDKTIGKDFEKGLSNLKEKLEE